MKRRLEWETIRIRSSWAGLAHTGVWRVPDFEPGAQPKTYHLRWSRPCSKTDRSRSVPTGQWPKGQSWLIDIPQVIRPRINRGDPFGLGWWSVDLPCAWNSLIVGHSSFTSPQRSSQLHILVHRRFSINNLKKSIIMQITARSNHQRPHLLGATLVNDRFQGLSIGSDSESFFLP